MTEGSKPTRAVKLFYSYSHKDAELREELGKHLSALALQQVVTDWYDRQIKAGEEWEKTIADQMDTADIILLLISSDFLASKYCQGVEVKKAMERHQAHEARVIPVILRPVDWRGQPFSRLQALPADAKPVVAWPNRDMAFLDIARGIRTAVEELLAEQVKHWFDKLNKAAALRNWPNVINLGERILEVLSDDAPTRSKTAAAYVKRWSRCLGEPPYMPQRILGTINVRTKKNENEYAVVTEMIADLDRAIQLEPENPEHYFVRSSLLIHRARCPRPPEAKSEDIRRSQKRAMEDLDHAIRLASTEPRYYFARGLARRYSDNQAALRDLQRARELGYSEAAVRWEEKLIQE